jgi:3',5'-cyclic AMP phosphodiesterase CpdA
MNFRFAIVSDPHIAIPETILDRPSRFHLVEVSVPAMETVLQHLEQLDLDFLLLPGDLTGHGERENHIWLQQRLALLPFPTYVIPGNHDVPYLSPTGKAIGFREFPHYYRGFGYDNPDRLYYSRQLLPGIRLIALNSNQFNSEGQQRGYLDREQLLWLEQTLKEVKNELVLVMIHHNVIEHLPQQASHELGRRYMLENAPVLLQMLREHGVKLIFTGHLHVQDIAQSGDIYEITTGSLVSFPHPYRVLEVKDGALKVESYRVDRVPGWENLSHHSREWIGDRSYPFMLRLLTGYPLYLPVTEAEQFIPHLRYFWADIAAGDALFDFGHFPEPLRRHFEQFGAISPEGIPTPIDNRTTIFL